MRATYKPNVAIGLAWGMGSNDDFREPWANQFADPKASSHLADAFYNGTLVLREYYVSVDGGRANLPIPTNANDLTVGPWEYALVRLLDQLTSGHHDNFEDYFRRAGFSR